MAVKTLTLERGTAVNNKLNLEKFSSLQKISPILEHSPEVWQAWLAELPLMNIGKSARLIHDALYQISLNHPADYNSWLMIIEHFRPAVASIQTSIDASYLAVDIHPLSKKLAIFGLLQNVQLSLIDAYSQLVFELTNAANKSSQQTIALAIHRAINYLTAILLQSSQVYTSAPMRLWAKLHKLYQVALDTQMTDFFARHALNLGNPNKTSIKGCYQRALLLSLANLYQLNFSDMQAIAGVLEQWSIKSQLRQDPEDSYYIFLDQDEPPIAKKLIADRKPQAAWLSLDLTLLVAFIERLANHPEQNTDKLITPALIQHLLRNWGNAPTRAFPRIKQDSQMRVCIGLSAIHYHMSAVTSSVASLPIKKLESTEDILATLSYDKKTPKVEVSQLTPGILNHEFPPADVWQPDFLLQKATDDKEITANTANIKPQYLTYNWHVIDSSPTGYGLYSTTDWPETLKVGELIGVQQHVQSIDNSWCVGVIRWIKQTFDGELLLGIQLLTMTASPIRIDALNDIASKPLRALFLPQVDTETTQTIITTNLGYPLDTELSIYYGATPYNIVFTKQINQEGNFRWFEFRMC